MAPQIYLITPANPDDTGFAATLMAVLNAAQVSAILVLRGAADDATYAKRASAIINIGQGAGCAVLLEDDVALAKRLGADGVHVNGTPDQVEDAVAALKPKLIVGAGAAQSRHDAMSLGECDIDYVFFGPLDGSTDSAANELAEWWAATFEIPAVLSDPQANGDTLDARGAEFIALSSSIWQSSDPAAAMRAIGQVLEAQP